MFTPYVNLRNISPEYRKYFSDDDIRHSERLRRESKALERESTRLQNNFWKERAEQSGIEYFLDADGNYRQKRDEQGRPLFKETEWDLFDDPKKGKIEQRRDRYGRVLTRPAQIKPGESLNDPHLYFNDGSIAGTAEELKKSPFSSQAEAAKEWERKRFQAREKAVMDTFNKKVALAEEKALSLKSEIDAKIAPEIEKIDMRLQELQQAPDWDETVGQWWKPKAMEKSTPAAQRLKREAQALQAKRDRLVDQQMSLAAQLEDGGDVKSEVDRAKAERELWKTKSDTGKYATLEQQRLDVLKRQGAGRKQIEEDPLLNQIRQKRQEQGLSIQNLEESLGGGDGEKPQQEDGIPDPQEAKDTPLRSGGPDEQRLKQLSESGAGPVELGLYLKRTIDEQSKVVNDESTTDKLRNGSLDRIAWANDALERISAEMAPEDLARLEVQTRDPKISERLKFGAGRVVSGFANQFVDLIEFTDRTARAILPGTEADDAWGEFYQAMREEGESWGTGGIPEPVVQKMAQSFWGSDVPQGMGSLLAFAAPAVLTTKAAQALGLGTKAVKAVGMGTTGTVGGGSMSNALGREVQESNKVVRAGLEEALKAGEITREQFSEQSDKLDLAENHARMIGFAAGTTEMLPLGAAINRMSGIAGGTTTPIIRMLTKGLAEGKSAQSLARVAKSAIRKGGEVVEQATEEGIQEYYQQIIENMGARGDLFNEAWDPTRGVVTDEALRGAAAGGVTGGIFSVLTQALPGKNRNIHRLARNDGEKRLNAILDAMRTDQDEGTVARNAEVSEVLQIGKAIEELQANAPTSSTDPDAAIAWAQQTANLQDRFNRVGNMLAEIDGYTPDPLIDPETGVPIQDEAWTQTNRDAARGFVKALFSPELMTQRERAALEAVQDASDPFIVEESGGVIITDAGREFLTRVTPSAEAFVPYNETQQRAQLSEAIQGGDARGTEKSENGVVDESNDSTGSTPPASDSDAAQPAQDGTRVKFTNYNDKEIEAVIPARATLADGTPVDLEDESTVRRWLAGNSGQSVRDIVEITPPAPPAQAKPRPEPAPAQPAQPPVEGDENTQQQAPAPAQQASAAEDDKPPAQAAKRALSEPVENFIKPDASPEVQEKQRRAHKQLVVRAIQSGAEVSESAIDSHPEVKIAVKASRSLDSEKARREVVAPLVDMLGVVAQEAGGDVFTGIDVRVVGENEMASRARTASVAFNQDGSISLFVNRDRVRGSAEKLVSAISHEGGHIVGRQLDMVREGESESFLQRQWRQLTPEQRREAAKQYDSDGLIELSDDELLDERGGWRARHEWLAFQWHRLLVSDTTAGQMLKEGYSRDFVTRLAKMVNSFKKFIKRHIGGENLSTQELDMRIREMIGGYQAAEYIGREPARAEQAPNADEKAAPAPAATPAPAAETKAAEPEPGKMKSGQSKDVTFGDAKAKVMQGKKKGKSFTIGERKDGGRDVLDIMRDNGLYISPPNKNSGGEYDGYAEVFASGPAKVLAREEGNMVDELVDILNQTGEINLDGPDAFWEAAAKAVKDRENFREKAREIEAEEKTDDAMFGNGGRNVTQKATKPVKAGELSVGDYFKVRGEKFEVKEVDPDTGKVTLEDGVIREVDEDMPIYADRDRIVAADYEGDPDDPFGQNPQEYVDRVVKEGKAFKASLLKEHGIEMPQGYRKLKDLAIPDARKAAKAKPEPTPEPATAEPLNLEGQTEEEIQADRDKLAAQEAKRKEREAIEQKQAAPLTGDSSDVGQGALFQDDADLFSGESQEQRARDETQQANPPAATAETSSALPNELYVGYEGRAQRRKIATVNEASKIHSETVKQQLANGEGASSTPDLLIFDKNDNPVGYVSWNGRVWTGKPQDYPKGKLVYDPTANPFGREPERQVEGGAVFDKPAMEVERKRTLYDDDSAVKSFADDIKLKGVGYNGDATYRVLEAEYKPGTYIVTRTEDGKREEVASNLGSIEAAQNEAIRLVRNDRLAPKAPKSAAKQPDAPIEDFGQKIGGARKDYAETMSEAEKLDLATEPLSKTWPEPDYAKLVESGIDPWIVGFIRAARDEVPAKPRKKYKVSRYTSQVKMLRDFANDLLSGEITPELVQQQLRDPKYINLSENVGGRAELYQLFGHDNSFKGIRFQKVHYSLYKGEKNVTKWSITRKGPATAFGNMPIELAVGDTRQEALDKFRDKLAEGIEKPKTKGVSFDIYQYKGGKKPGVYIGKKIGKYRADLFRFDDAKQARTFLRDNYDDVIARLEAFKRIGRERKMKNAPRIGDDHRKGIDVTVEQFDKTFGFRGVEFGNYVEQSRRQLDLNKAYDALMDLAGILNIPPKAISLDGKLALAFGARGKGGKEAPAAHYEPDRVVINLTKRNGPGSLAHEWWHAVDNYFGKKTPIKDFMTEGRAARLAGKGSPFINPEGIREEMTRAFGGVINAINETGLPERSRELDKRKTKNYWSQMLEMTARSFENYVIERLAAKKASNDYLANVNDVSAYADSLLNAFFTEGKTAEDLYPYLTQDEIAPVAAAFDEFFKTVKTKETNTGVALFTPADRQSRRPTPRTRIINPRGKPGPKLRYYMTLSYGGRNVPLYNTTEPWPEMGYKEADATLSEDSLRKSGYRFEVPPVAGKVLNAPAEPENSFNGGIQLGVPRSLESQYLETSKLKSTDYNLPASERSAARTEYIKRNNITDKEWDGPTTANPPLGLWVKSVKWDPDATGGAGAYKVEIWKKRKIAEYQSNWTEHLGNPDMAAAGVLMKEAAFRIDNGNKVWDYLEASANLVDGPSMFMFRMEGNTLSDVKQSGGVKRLNAPPEKESAPDFYLKSIKAIEDKMPEQAPPAQVAGIIRSAGIKPEEIKWSGVIEWLQNQSGKVVKSDVVQYLKDADGLRFNEVNRDDGATSIMWRVDSGGMYQHFETEQEAREYLGDDEGTIREETIEAEEALPGYEDYQLPGGENYREVILQMEGDDYTSSHYEANKGYIAHMRLNERDGGLFIEEIQSDRHQEGRKKGYRTNSASLADIKTAALERLRSIINKEDYLGFDTRGEAIAAIRDHDDWATRWDVRNPDVVKAGNEYREADKAWRENLNAIPDAPFRKDWPLQMFKRALRDAIAGNKEWVGWTSGDTQADRYDLSHQVQELKLFNRGDGSRWDVSAIKKGGGLVDIATDISANSLSEHVGKEIAGKALKDQPGKGWINYSGLDLKVGGEGMIGFYDNILPKEIGRYVKKWGASVEKAGVQSTLPGYGIAYKGEFLNDVRWDYARDAESALRQAGNSGVDGYQVLPDAGTQTPIWRVNITDQMRKSVKALGQPLFTPQDRPNPALRATLTGILDTLPENPRMAFTYYTGGSTFADIAKRQKTDTETASKRVMNVMKVLKKRTGEDDNAIMQAMGAQNRQSQGATAVDENEAERFLKEFSKAHGRSVEQLLEDPFLYNQAWEVFRSINPETLYTPQENDDAAEIERLMAMLEVDLIPISQDEVDQAMAKPQNQKTDGRPDLANPAGDDEQSRRFVDIVDERRKYEQERQTFDQWTREAAKQINADFKGVVRRLLEAAQDPNYSGTGTAVDIIASKMAVQRLTREAIMTGNEELMRQAEILTWAYREEGTEQARAFAARRDTAKRPLERHAEFILSELYKPSPALAKAMESAMSPAEKSRRIDRLQRELAKARANKADRSEIIRLEKQLRATKAQKDKFQMLHEETRETVHKLERALMDNGVTFDDLFSGEVSVKLKGAKIVENLAATKEAKAAKVIRMINQGKMLPDIAKATGLKQKEVNRIIREAEDDLRKKLADKVRKGFRSADLTVNTLGTPGEAVDMTDEEVAFEVDKMLIKLGFGPKAGKPKIDLADPSIAVQTARTAQALKPGRTKASDYLYEFWINSILSGPQTQVVNIAGNSLNAAWKLTIQRGVEAVINESLGKFKDPNAARMGEFRYMLKGILPGLIEGVNNAAVAWGSEVSLFRNRYLNEKIRKSDTGKVESYQGPVIPGKAGKVIRLPGRFLIFMDELFKGFIIRTEVGAHAYRIARAEGMKGDSLTLRINELVNDIGGIAWKRAADDALTSTFQEDFDKGSRAGSIAAWIAEGRDGGTGGTRFGLRWLVPFVRTLFNIIKTGVRMSPLGAITLTTNSAKGLWGVKNGRPFYQAYGNPRFIQNVAEQMLAWTATAMMLGMVEGDEDDEDKPILITGSRSYFGRVGENQLQNRLGLPAYTIRFKLGDEAKFFQFGRYEPLSTVLGIVADSVRTIKRAPRQEGSEMLGDFISTVGEQIESKNFAKGIGDILSIIRDGREISRIGPQFVSSFVPNIFRQPIRVADPYAREYSKETASKDLPGRLAEATIESILPWTRSVSVDLWGNPMRKEGTAASRLAIPQRAGSSPEVNRLDQLLLNYVQKFPGKAGELPTEPRRNYVMDGETYYMNDEEFRTFAEKSGKLAFQRLSRMPLNVNNPTEKDVEKIKDAISDARRMVRNSIKTRKRRTLSTN